MPVIEVVSVRHPSKRTSAQVYAYVHRMQFELFASVWTTRWAWRDGDLVAKTVWHESGQCVRDEYVVKPWDPRERAKSAT